MKSKTEKSAVSKELLSSSSAAKLAGVTPSTIKRWADEGILPCERTAGGHRRFKKSTVIAFLREQKKSDKDIDAVQSWIKDLIDGSHYNAVSGLYRLRQELGSWSKAAAALEPVIEELGDSWARGEITIAQEHRASECLSRAIWQVGNALPAIDSPPVALLATAEGDQHSLGLRLAELCLLNQQWSTVWVGPNTPTEVLLDHISTEKFDLLLVSASPFVLSDEQLATIGGKLSEKCMELEIDLIFGGNGNWPVLDYGVHVSSFEEFDRIIQDRRE